MGAFSGIRVLDFGQIYNGPYCGLLMALHGAEVIKVEPPGGERLRYRSTAAIETHEFMMLNSCKKSVVLDLKKERGRTLARELIGKSDVLIENFSPGAAEKIGLGASDVMKANPRLIYASGKGYGSEGPYAQMSAMDLTVQAMSGVISTTGFPDGRPVKAGPAFVDFMGGIHLLAGVAMALFERERTGRGKLVEVSMHDTVYPCLASALGALYNESGREVPERTGNMHSGLAISPYNVYRSQDGWIAIITVAERHFEGVAKTIGHPEITTDLRFSDRLTRIEHMAELDCIIEEWTSRHTRNEVVEALSAEGVPCAPVKSIQEVADDPHLLKRGMIQEVDHPKKGRVRVPASAIRFADGLSIKLEPAPPLGGNTDTVLRDLLGIDEAEIQNMKKEGVVG